jgi:hypothetical protein
MDRIGFGTGVDTTALMDDLIEALGFCFLAQLLSQSLELQRLLVAAARRPSSSGTPG